MEKRATVGELQSLSIDDVEVACEALDSWQDAEIKASPKPGKR